MSAGSLSPVRLPYEEAWSAAAVQAVLEALPWLVGRQAELSVPRLRQLAKDQVAVLALTRWLAEHRLEYRLEPTRWARWGRDPIRVQRRHVYPFATLVSRRAVLRRLRRASPDPEWWATVPEARWQSAEGRPEDILVFGYVLALVASTPEENVRAQSKGLPLRLLYPLPAAWQRWPYPQSLALKYEGPGSLSLTLHGQTEQGWGAYDLALPEKQRLTTEPRWVELYALSTAALPEGRLGVSRPGGSSPLIVSPTQWGNVWLYGLEVWWLGYLTRRAFDQQARRLPSGTDKGAGVRLGQAAYGVPLHALRPMDDLAARLIGG